MIPISKRIKRGTRKRTTCDDSESELLPLRAKSTNVKKRTGFDKNIRFLGDTNSVGGGKADKYMKQADYKDSDNLLFASDHVSIRLGESTPKRERRPKGSPQNSQRDQQEQRLIDSPNTSLQISDFDVPPESTSTPLPSPGKPNTSLINRSEEVRFSPIYHSTNYNWIPELHDPETIGQRIYSPPKTGKRYYRSLTAHKTSSGTSDDIAYHSSAGDATYHGSESNT